MMVLMRFAHAHLRSPVSMRVDDVELDMLLARCICFTGRGQVLLQLLGRSSWQLSRNVPPSFREDTMSYMVDISGVVASHEVRLVDQVGGLDRASCQSAGG